MLKQINSNGVVVLVVCILGLAASFFFLAHTKQIEEKDSYYQAKLDSVYRVNEDIKISARKRKDSFDDTVRYYESKLKNYDKIDNEINTSTSSYSDKQLDSILTNYRYIPLSKETAN